MKFRAIPSPHFISRLTITLNSLTFSVIEQHLQFLYAVLQRNRLRNPVNPMDGLVKAMTLSRILYTSDEANVAN